MRDLMAPAVLMLVAGWAVCVWRRRREPREGKKEGDRGGEGVGATVIVEAWVYWWDYDAAAAAAAASVIVAMTS